MQNHSENTKRIAKNTLMLYGRMLFSMAVSLYTSRIVLNALGIVDYGIYNAVGGFVAMFSLISTSLSSAVSRFLTYELGRGDKARLSKAFSTSLLIHMVLAAMVFMVAETIGVWFVNNKMTIPIERLYAAKWVFQASILSFMFGLFSVPYNASIVSHERMGAFAYISILDTILRLLIVLFIAYSKWHFDKLIIYSVLLVATKILFQCIYLLYCRKHFEECRLMICFDKEFWRDMSAFAGWNFIGCAAGMLKEQGVNLLLNIFVGPVINAARGISSTVNGAVVTFVSNFMTALNPQITKSYASNDYDYAFSLVKRGSRFAFYIILIIGLPILLETEFVLNLWLGHYPDHAVSFVRLALVLSLSEVPSQTLITLQLATGRIRNYQIVVGGVLLLNFPLSYILLRLGCLPESTYVVAIVVSIVCLFLRLIFLKKMANFSIGDYLTDVLFNILLVFVISFTVPTIIHNGMDYGWFRFISVSILSVTCSLITVLYVGCSKHERLFLLSKFMSIFRKFIYAKDCK